jgi:hypothetical protein
VTNFAAASALFTMKRGLKTEEDVTLYLFDGSFSSGWDPGRAMRHVTLHPAGFTQQYEAIAFTFPTVTLQGSHAYTAVLWSGASDEQSKACFLKDVSVLYADANGNPIPPTGGTPNLLGAPVANVPEPGTAALLAAGLVLAAGFGGRRKTAERGSCYSSMLGHRKYFSTNPIVSTFADAERLSFWRERYGSTRHAFVSSISTPA